MITHGKKQISEIVYARKASEGGGAVRLTNIIRGAQVVFGGKVPFNVWLTDAATTAILAAFGQTDGKAVIKATNAYLKALAATDKIKASALARLINEDPMMVCSFGLQPQGVQMPIRYAVSNESGIVDSGVIGTEETRLIFKGILYSNNIALFGADASYNSRNFTAWLRYMDYNSDSIGYAGNQIYGTSSIGITPSNKPFTLDANKNHWSNHLADGTLIWDNTFNQRAFTTPHTMGILEYFRNNNVIFWGKKGCASCEIFQDDIHKLFVPFIRNGEMEMLDIISMEVGSRIGTLSESYTLPDGTPWTPLNKTP